MNELTCIFEQLTANRQDQVLALARALLDEQQTGGFEAASDSAGSSSNRGRPRGRKGSSYETTKSVKNSAGQKYSYRVHVTVDANGKRKEKYLGRINQ